MARSGERSLQELADRVNKALSESPPDDLGDGFRARIQDLLLGVYELVHRAEGTRADPVKITDEEEF